jgi:hypothetical protein
MPPAKKHYLSLAVASCVIAPAFAGRCRMENPHEGCALPYELGNFQGFYECGTFP